MKESNLNMIKYRMNDKEFKEAMIRKNCLAMCNSWNHDWNEYMKAVNEVDNYFSDYYSEHEIHENGKSTMDRMKCTDAKQFMSFGKIVSAPTYKEVLIATIKHFKDSFIHQCVINDIL